MSNYIVNVCKTSEKDTVTDHQLKTLSKKRQSPIDIRDDCTHLTVLQPLKFIGHWLNDGQAVLHNNGKYAKIVLGGDRIPSIIKCGPLHDEYELDNVHFHWGQDYSSGSEHSINGTFFSMESHAVHWNRKYKSIDECMKYEDGICILAFFLQIKRICNCGQFSSLSRVTDYLRDISECKSSTVIPANCLYWMNEATRCNTYYFYKGSLTTADYPECAIWIIFPNAIAIHEDQVSAFKKLKNSKGKLIVSNNRKTQALFHRKIYKAAS